MYEEEAPYVSKTISNRWWIHAVLLVLLGLTLYPMVFMVLNAFRTGLATDITPFGLPLHPIWQNFSIALGEILPAFKQSFIIVGVSVAGILTCALLSAFAFAELEFPGKTVLFYLVFGLLLIPGFPALLIGKKNNDIGRLFLGGHRITPVRTQQFYTLAFDLVRVQTVVSSHDYLRALHLQRPVGYSANKKPHQKHKQNCNRHGRQGKRCQLFIKGIGTGGKWWWS